MTDLFDPFQLGPLTLPNRVVMAPLTRSRAGAGDVPGPMNATYYAQRASAGLIISEATQITQQGKGYAFTPGIETAAQVEGWKLVTAACMRRAVASSSSSGMSDGSRIHRCSRAAACRCRRRR